jgi:DNA-binding NarL/FixJ family response regulator
MTQPIRLVLADDHPVFRSGLRALLERERDLEVVAEADDGDAALAAILHHRPGVALLDLDMPKRDAFSIMQAIAISVPETAVVVLTAHRDEGLVNRACDLGIKGFILKDSPGAEISECIRAVYRGEVHISARVSGALLARAERAAVSSPGGPKLPDLTPTERRILALIADQQSTKQIAAALFISVRTVDRHRSNMCAKLNVTGTNGLIKFAIAQRSTF